MTYFSPENFRILSSISTSLMSCHISSDNNTIFNYKSYPFYSRLIEHTSNFSFQDFSNKISNFKNNNTQSTNNPIYSNLFIDYKDEIQNFLSLNIRYGKDLELLNRKKVVLVGTGFAAIKFLSKIDVTKFDVTIISPRNYFTYTPILPLATTGLISPESCTASIYPYTIRGGKSVIKYQNAWVSNIEHSKDMVICSSENGENFSLSYDYLVLAFGVVTNTFGIPGVAENAHYLKDITDAIKIKKHFLQNLEKASQSNLSDDEKRKLLKIIVVGAGPSGVETAAEIREFMIKDGKYFFPNLFPFMSVTLVEMLPNTLPTYTKESQKFSEESLSKMAVDIKLKTAVTHVTSDTITYSSKITGSPVESTENYGILIWTSGIDQAEIGKKFLASLPEQLGNRFLNVNGNLQVKGSNNIFAIGDCGTLKPNLLVENYETLFKEAEHTSNGAGSSFMSQKATEGLDKLYPQLHKRKYNFNNQPQKDHLSKQEFKNYLESIDKNYKSPTPTAQTAEQEGNYLASCFNKYYHEKSTKTEQVPVFVESFRGSFAYVGNGRALYDSPSLSSYTGRYGCLWKLAYLGMHPSIRGQVNLGKDLILNSIFGNSSNSL